MDKEDQALAAAEERGWDVLRKVAETADQEMTAVERTDQVRAGDVMREVRQRLERGRDRLRTREREVIRFDLGSNHPTLAKEVRRKLDVDSAVDVVLNRYRAAMNTLDDLYAQNTELQASNSRYVAETRRLEGEVDQARWAARDALAKLDTERLRSQGLEKIHGEHVKSIEKLMTDGQALAARGRELKRLMRAKGVSLRAAKKGGKGKGGKSKGTGTGRY